MVNIPLPGLPDIKVDVPDVKLPKLPDLPGLPDIKLPKLPDIKLPTVPGTDIPAVPGIGLWPVVKDVDVEKEFWELVDNIDRLTLKYSLPAPLLRPILDQFSLIDSDKLRAVAKVWGTSMADLGIPATVGTEVPKRVGDLTTPLGERWTGAAYTSFKKSMGELGGIVAQYGAPAHDVGAVLNDLAEKFDLTWIEVIGFVGAIASFVVSAILWALPEPVISKGLAVVLDVIGAILTVVGTVVAILDSTLPRINAARDAADKLAEEINKKIPRADDSRVRLPDRGKWQPRTPDPNS